MNIGYAWRLLRHHWVAILIVALLGGVGAALWMSLSPVSHVATSSVLVRPGSEADKEQYLAKPERFIQSQIRVLQGDPVLEKALADSADSRSPESLRGRLDVEGGSVDDVIDVSVTSHSSATSRKLVSAVTNAYLATTESNAEVLSTEASEVGEHSIYLLLGGLLGGFMLAVVVVLASGAVRRPILGADYLDDLPGATEVFPFDLPSSSQPERLERPGFGLLLSTLFTRADRGTCTVLVVDVGDGSAQLVTDGLVAAARSRGMVPDEASGVEGGGITVLEKPVPDQLGDSARGRLAPLQGDPERLIIGAAQPGLSDPRLLAWIGEPEVVVYSTMRGRGREPLLADYIQAIGRPDDHAVVVVMYGRR